MQATATPVRDERLRRGWTQADLAAKCAEMGAPISDSQLSKIERGLWRGRPKVRAVIAELLGLDPVHDFPARSA